MEKMTTKMAFEHILGIVLAPEYLHLTMTDKLEKIASITREQLADMAKAERPMTLDEAMQASPDVPYMGRR